MSYFLPEGYSPRDGHCHFLDVPTALRYQPHVYELALFLARRAGVKRIIDIGCGSGAKLTRISSEFEVIGVDCEVTIPLFRDNVPNARWIVCDLDEGVPQLSGDDLRDAVVICADVIEHLKKPDRLARYLAEINNLTPFVLISTPDRDRVRNWLDAGPPANPSHVMEWGAGEFLRFLQSAGFDGKVLYGHTINTDFHMANTTTIALGGSQAYPRDGIIPRKVAAVIHCFNEVDIISEVVRHLVKEGVHVYLYDNWSTDGTWEVAVELRQLGLLAYLGRFPETPSREYEWARLLQHTEEVAVSIDADWVIHYDADELRYSPWPGVTLAEGISWACGHGYNAIDFTVLDFRFIAARAEAAAPYEASLNHFQFGRREGHFVQVKAWQNNRRVHLVSSGGHEALFEGRRIFPLKFLTKHYPLRSASQAQRKVFGDRLPRVQREQSERGWHTQYNQYVQQGSVLGWSRHELQPWAEQIFHTEFIVQRLSGIGLAD